MVAPPAYVCHVLVDHGGSRFYPCVSGGLNPPSNQAYVTYVQAKQSKEQTSTNVFCNPYI